MQAEVYKNLAKEMGSHVSELCADLGVDQAAALVAWQSYFTIPG